MSGIKCIQGDPAFTNRIISQPATYMMVGASTQTAEIPNITVAGLPGYIGYTPALDYETLYYGHPRSLPDIALSPEGPPSPVLIPAIILNHFQIPHFFIDAGVEISPKAPHIRIDSRPGASMLEGAGIDAKSLFEEGKRVAAQFAHLRGIIYLCECVPGGTSTAYALMKALGYACDFCFASSTNTEETRSIKEQTVKEALNRHEKDIHSPLDAVAWLGDPMQAFLSGFAHALANEKSIVLAGGTQMAAVYALLKKLDMGTSFENIALVTTKWIVEDSKSDIAGLLQMIDPSFNAFYADFSFEESRFENLRLYDQGLVKEGVGAGAMLSHALLHGMNQSDITQAVDSLFGKITAQ